ncbi:MAG: chromosomal replication initiator protein DnaA [Planctomycetota bacterium]|nr:chromosomal replication initiator protein DnaA [Planctomycetota bacterium]
MVDSPSVDLGLKAEPNLQELIFTKLFAKIRREQFETWFKSLRICRMDDREMEFSVTSQFVRDWIQKNHLPTLQEVANIDGKSRKLLLAVRNEDGWDSLAFLGADATVRLAENRIVEGAEPPRFAEARGVHASGMPPSGRALGQSVHEHKLRRAQLNPNYTFDKFIVGPCNRLAHAATLAAGENPGSAYNPLFIHGNVGLGKSHLLQAICQNVMKQTPQARVLYLSCEDFTNTFINAIQNNALDEFRNFHRRVDVLVIDDIQFLASKDKTQDEFFHTFNALYDAQKQIVMSSDRPPVDIPTIEERLVSRFKWGLVAEIEAPCFDTRVAIVRRKAKGRGADFTEEVANYIAERVTVNIRELEGAVIKVVGVAAITGRPVSLQLAEEALRGVAVTRLVLVSVDDVMGLITAEFALSARDLTGKSRTQAVSLPRQIAMFLLREHTEMSLEDIGRIFGNRDHTTVLYAVTKIRDRTQTDRMFKDMLDGLGARLMGRQLR